MTSLLRGTPVTVVQSEGEWRLVRFADRQWGERAGYIHCSMLDPARPTTESR